MSDVSRAATADHRPGILVAARDAEESSVNPPGLVPKIRENIHFVFAIVPCHCTMSLYHIDEQEWSSSGLIRQRKVRRVRETHHNISRLVLVFPKRVATRRAVTLPPKRALYRLGSLALVPIGPLWLNTLHFGAVAASKCHNGRRIRRDARRARLGR